MTEARNGAITVQSVGESNEPVFVIRRAGSKPGVNAEVGMLRSEFEALPERQREVIRGFLPSWTGTWEELLEVAEDL